MNGIDSNRLEMLLNSFHIKMRYLIDKIVQQIEEDKKIHCAHTHKHIHSLPLMYCCTPCEQCSLKAFGTLSWAGWSMVQWLRFVWIACFCRSLSLNRYHRSSRWCTSRCNVQLQCCHHLCRCCRSRLRHCCCCLNCALVLCTCIIMVLLCIAT